MHKLTFIAALVLAGCGGSDEPDDKAHYRAQAIERAETICEAQGGLRVVYSEAYSYSRNGSLIDVGLDCECGNGYRFRTLMRRE